MRKETVPKAEQNPGVHASFGWLPLISGGNNCQSGIIIIAAKVFALLQFTSVLQAQSLTTTSVM